MRRRGSKEPVSGLVLAGLIVSLAVLATSRGPASAFDLLAEPPAGRMTMRLHLGDQRFSTLGYGTQSWNSLATAALARWNEVGIGTGHDHQFFSVGSGGAADPCNTGDGISEVRFAGTLCGFGWGDIIGVTRRRMIDGKTVQADVLFNSVVPMNAYPGPLRGSLVDFYRLALHELGHVAGLDHPDEAGQRIDAVMNSAPVADDLRADDVAGAHAIAWGTSLIEQFVRGFYTTILGREPSASEVAAWVDDLRTNPEGAGAIVRGFFHSQEFLTARRGTVADYVTLLYVTILLRPPAPAEIDAWVPVVVTRLNRLVPGFVSSPEFQALLRTTPPATVVTRLYQLVLGRTPSATEVADWVAILDRTGDWSGVSIGFLASPEYLGGARTFAEHVGVLYRTFLGRSPSTAEVSAWLSILTSHLGDIENGFTASPEFQARLVF